VQQSITLADNEKESIGTHKISPERGLLVALYEVATETRRLILSVPIFYA
jgi:hypothetical protein